MALLVQKYGGTSVGGVERIQAVAKRVARARLDGHDLVVVVSAMGHTTDELTALARKSPGNHKPGKQPFRHMSGGIGGNTCGRCLWDPNGC